MKVEERKTAMSHDEMQDYWKTLCSFTGEDIPNEIKVDKNLIISMAKEAGVKNIYQSYIDETNSLNAYLLTDV